MSQYIFIECAELKVYNNIKKSNVNSVASILVQSKQMFSMAVVDGESRTFSNKKNQNLSGMLGKSYHYFGPPFP